ncbi:hypothetical protein GCM10012284_54840 [Mangrovihabitans endophyticus]|uniref:Uncharacterized protein n=2 Tax=Mangrovihabitans endophyticus TaxID=1751298 RepID=A0A8J3FR63_9ACTN|nr:hypothetical protein GCM10012284_54840 [Mangrovihabitans endophyticus]
MIDGYGARVRRGDLADLDGLAAAASDVDGVVHLAFRHDLMRSGELAAAVAADLAAVRTLGEALAGTGGALAGSGGALAGSGGALAGSGGALASASGAPAGTGEPPSDSRGPASGRAWSGCRRSPTVDWTGTDSPVR